MTESPVFIDHEGRWHLASFVTGVESDSRKIEPGHVFVAIQGHMRDGHAYVAEAERRGAVAAVVERLVTGVGIPLVQVSSTRKAEAHLAAEFYGHPAEHLSVIGVTGTNGKTSVVYWLRHLLQGTHHPAG